MKVAAIRIELHIGAAQSLKEKRSVLRPVIEGLRRNVSLSVAEVLTVSQLIVETRNVDHQLVLSKDLASALQSLKATD